MHNVNNKVSSLTAAVEKVDSSLQILRSMTAEELKAEAPNNVKKAYEAKMAEIEAIIHHLIQKKK